MKTVNIARGQLNTPAPSHSKANSLPGSAPDRACRPWAGGRGTGTAPSGGLLVGFFTFDERGQPEWLCKVGKSDLGQRRGGGPGAQQRPQLKS